MKKIVLLTLALAMVFSMAACGCNHQWHDATCLAPKTCTLCGETQGAAGAHTAGEEKVAAVDAEKLIATMEVACADCGAVMESREGAPGMAPQNGKMRLSPMEWFNCLSTNIYQYGANNTLAAFTAESQDNALVLGVISFNGMKAAFTFLDAEGNIITTDRQDQRDLVNSVQVEGLFDNTTATEFYQLLMLLGITNNSAMDPAAANTLASSIMSFETVAENGYIYDMGILSAEDHKVLLTITAK